MPIDYAALAATATRLLIENGVPMALRRRQPASFDPITGTSTDNPPKDLPTTGVFRRIDLFMQVTGRGVGGVPRVDNVVSTDRAVTIDGSQIPQIDDLLVAPGDAMTDAVQQWRQGILNEAAFRALLATQGELWQVVDAEKKNPGGVLIASVLTVRK